MNYLLVHLNSEVPSYVSDCISSIKIADPHSEIYLCTDQVYSNADCNILDLSSVISSQTNEVINSSFYKNDSNILWKTSMWRIFVLRDMANFLGLSNYVHFDSDVILLQPFDSVKNQLTFDGLSITPCSEREFVFGYSFFSNPDKHNFLCDILFSVLEDTETQNKLCHRWGKGNIPPMVNEMQLMAGIYDYSDQGKNLISILNTMPTETTNVIFDPSSYGQHLFGTCNAQGPGYAERHHWIGDMILDGNLKVYIEDGVAFAEKENKKTKIANLHIHSKNTSEVLDTILNKKNLFMENVL